MWWRVGIAALIIISIIAGGVLLRNQVAAACITVETPLNAVLKALPAHPEQEAPRFTQARERWERDLPFLSAIVTHELLDQVSLKFSEANGYLKMGKAEEFIAAVQVIVQQLELVRDYDLISVRSVL